MSAVLRLKRKACAEPAEGLMVALKKSKFENSSDKNEVFFKFAGTLKNETDSVKDQLQAALKDKSSKYRDPRRSAIVKSNVKNISERLKLENKAASDKKRLDLLNTRRLIFSETLPIDKSEESHSPNAEVWKMFKLYDIIEENEDVKKQGEETENTITCNDELLVREKPGDYVYDVYISDAKIDDSFVEHPVCVRPCAVTNDDIYSGGSDSDDVYEDEDDSNDENNWRNDYPEDAESSCSDKESDDDCDIERPHYREVIPQFDHLHVRSNYDDDEEDEEEEGYRIQSYIDGYHDSSNLSSKEDDYEVNFSD